MHVLNQMGPAPVSSSMHGVENWEREYDGVDEDVADDDDDDYERHDADHDDVGEVWRENSSAPPAQSCDSAETEASSTLACYFKNRS